MQLALLFLWIAGVAIGWEQGDAARTRVMLMLYPSASTSSKPIGRLAADTVVLYKGEMAPPLALVDVELESGWVSGWVLAEELDFKGRGGGALKRPTRERVAPKKRGVPGDEKLLLRREPSFLYGAEIGGNWGLVSLAERQYGGLGFVAGGRIGLFVSPATSLELRVDYALLTGVESDNGATGGVATESMEFGYCYLLGAIAQRLSQVEASLLGGYAIGLSLPDALPVDAAVGSPLDLSSPVVAVALAYRIEMGEFARMNFGAQYRFHVFNTPALVHLFLATVAVTLEG